MLESLHVKNLALIEEEEIEFKKGLNILTGETVEAISGINLTDMLKAKTDTQKNDTQDYTEVDNKNSQENQ